MKTNEETTIGVCDDAGVCVVDWNILIDTDHDLSTLIEEAYGSQNADSIGILAIRNVPGFVEAKNDLFHLTHALAVQLPEEYRETQLTDVTSLYNAGWSFGKEKLGIHKPPDTAKGSYYYNPVTDLPGSQSDRDQYPVSYPINKWPSDEYKDLLPRFKEKAKRVGLILKDVTVHVSKHIDQYAVQKLGSDRYPPNFLYTQLKDTEKVKARLLYYYPLSCDGKESVGIPTEDSWIGWHNDSGFLTALAGEMYVDHETGKEINELNDVRLENIEKDFKAGLYVLTRSNQLKHVRIPSDCCAVQIGECTQIVTAGAVLATPHCVRGIASTTTNSDLRNVARISLPCFVDTPPQFALSVPMGSTRKQVLDASIGTSESTTDDITNNKIPPLESRWTHNGMTFGNFLQQTFSMYYEWNQ